jgi:hypothetical protein
MSVGALQVPAGDPAAVLAAANQLATLASGTEQARASFRAHSTYTVSALTNPRAADVAEAAGSVNRRLEASARQFALAGKVLKDYGEALAAAKAAVTSIATRHWDEGVKCRRLTDQGSDSAGTEMALVHSAQRQVALEIDAEVAQAELLLAAQRAAVVLDAAAGIAVPGAAGMSPEQILAKVLGGWDGIVKGATTLDKGYQEFKKLFDPLDSTRGLLGAPMQGRAAYAILERWKDAEAARLVLRQTAAFENSVLDSWLIRQGDPRDSFLLRRYMLARQNISAVKATSDATKVAHEAAKLRFVETVKLTSKFAKVTGVLAIGGGVHDAVFPDPDHHGVRRLGDRVSGAMSALAGGASLIATVAPTALTLGPAGAAVIAGALLITAAWTVGNLIYDNREWIGHKLSDAGGWAGDRASDAWRSVKGLVD